MIATVLLPNVIAIVLLLVLLGSANNVSRHLMMLDTKIFYFMVCCNLIQCMGEIAAYAVNRKMFFGARALAFAINAMLFIVNIYFAAHWVMYVDFRVFEDAERIKKNRFVILIPAFAVMIGVLVNLFVPVFFRITADNDYQRTTLFIIPYIVTYSYLLYGTVFIYRNKERAGKYLFLPAVVFMMPILLGSLVQFFFYGYSTVWVGVAVGLTSLYVNVQNEMSYIDGLSGLYSRSYMYRCLEAMIHRHDSHKKIGGIMMDIDEFKKINDTCGHLVGDEAIRETGKLLHEVMGSNGIAARYGGDEFVVIQVIRSVEDLIATRDRIKRAERAFNSQERAYKIRLSIGMGIMDPASENADSFLDRIDGLMYEDKKKRKLKMERR